MQVSAHSLLGVIVLLPLLGAFVNGVLGARFSRSTVHLIGVGSVAVAFVLALRCVYALYSLSEGQPHDPHLADVVYTWAVSGMFQFDVAFYLDPLSAVMLLVVTGVGLLIHIYSTGYMSDDPGFARYFAYLNLFMFSMLCLILGKNLLMLFVGWEGVGVCSYLLIGFWFTDDAKAQAGQKAFVVNRIGDVGFIIGLILVLFHCGGTTDYEVLQWRFEQTPWGPFYDPNTLMAACLFMFLGACGKSAQIPLYVWLPDAMAGPTPVSALIHAATMVTAGVYMIARLAFMFTLSPIAMGVIATIGALTALAAALMALTQRDIKGVLAYSTVSQLGYMILAVGVGAYVAGIFHLMTHAFFKALLFLAAGSVIHGLGGKQDIWGMGGLRKKMPITAITFGIATLAIAGTPLMSGYFSKDMILWEVHSRQQLLPVPDKARAAWSDGQEMLIGGKQATILRGDGSTWSREALPPTNIQRGTARQQALPGVRGIFRDASGTDWAVAEYATVYRSDGGRWERVWQAEPKLMSRHLNAAWGASQTDLWFVGDRGLIVHYDGKEFGVVESGTLATLNAVSGTGAGDVWAGGAGGALLRWDGAAWAAARSTGTASITGLVAHGGTVWGTTGRGAVLEVRNGAMSRADLGLSDLNVVQLTALSSSGETLVVAGAGVAKGEPYQRPIVLRRGGDGAWTVSLAESGPTVRAVGMVGGSVVAAGDGGRLLVSQSDGGLLAQDTVPSKPWYHSILWIMAVVTAGLTAFYMFRLYLITFEGPTRADEHTWDHAHESPPSMTVPLVILAVLSIFGGWIGAESLGSPLQSWLAPAFRIADGRLLGGGHHTFAAHIPTIAAAAGFLIALWWYRKGIGAVPQKLAEVLKPLYLLSRNKFYVDEIYDAIVVGPYRFVAGVFYRIVDVKIIDFLLTRVTASVVQAAGSVIRLWQNGDVQRYAVGVVVGLASVIWLMGV